MRPLIALSLLWTISLQAGDSAGHGGDLVICESQHGPTYQVLDYFEALQADPAYTLNFASEGSTSLDKVRAVLQRLSQFDSARAAYYLKRAEAFKSESLEVAGPLTLVSDSGLFSIPEGCQVRQLAIQRPPAFPGDERYVLDRNLWATLSAYPDQQAVLILHEIIVGETVMLGHETTEAARRFTRFISSSGFSQVAQATYNKIATEVFFIVPKVKFTQNEYLLTVGIDESWELNLLQLMAVPYPSQIEWVADAKIPAWLKLDSGKAKLYGQATSADLGSRSFFLVARSGKSHALAKITVEIY